MKINFKEISFKNILSFGAKEHIINFAKGLTIITGSNGSGKSVLLDALSFCLFGKPYRNIKIKELINRKNKKNLSVSCSFQINDTDTYKITRTLNSDSLQIFKNGSESNLLSSKKLNQDELDNILGINYPLFKQIISLAINYNQPFLTLSAEEKRKIIEQIFNITIFGMMLKNAKKTNSKYLAQNEINNTALKLFKENLKTLRNNLKNITQLNDNFEKNKNIKLNQINEKINQNTKKLNEITALLKTQQNQIDALSSESINDKLIKIKTNLNEIIKEINNKEFLIISKNTIIKNLEMDVICQRCHTKLTQEHKMAENKLLLHEINDIQKQLKKYTLERNKLNVILDEFENKKLDLEMIKSNFNKNSMTFNFYKEQLEELKNDYNQTKDQKLEINLNENTQTFNSKIQEYKNTFKEHTKIKQSINNFDIIINILSESGIKAFFFKKLIPILNLKINEYLKLFKIPILLTFDELMNEKIINFDNNNNISYYSYSEGEKKRIDMAILLSFINITKIISNWNCNLLLIDELLDSAIDEAGLDNLVDSLKEMSINHEMCIYIISHRLKQEHNAKFDFCLNIEKKDSFSKIKNS